MYFRSGCYEAPVTREDVYREIQAEKDEKQMQARIDAKMRALGLSEAEVWALLRRRV